MKQGPIMQGMEDEAADAGAQMAKAPVGGAVGGPLGGFAGWMLKHLRGRRGAEPRLAVLERIALAPRQTLALVEADGRRFLVATSPEGTPSFQALDAAVPHTAKRTARVSRPDRARPDREARISW